MVRTTPFSQVIAVVRPLMKGTRNLGVFTVGHIDEDLNKTQLQDLAGFGSATMAKLGKGANVTTDVLV